MPKMLIKWNKPSVWGVCTGLGDSSLVKFIPGSNDIDSDQWDLIKNHPDVQARLVDQVFDVKKKKMVPMLEIVTKVCAPLKAEEKAELVAQGISEEEMSTLSRLNTPHAKELVFETYNTPLLREWLNVEPRKAVQNAIEKQLKAIEEERNAKPKKEEQELVVDEDYEE